MEFHSEEFRNDPMLKVGMDNIDKGEWLIDIGEALPMYDRIGLNSKPLNKHVATSVYLTLL